MSQKQRMITEFASTDDDTMAPKVIDLDPSTPSALFALGEMSGPKDGPVLVSVSDWRGKITIDVRQLWCPPDTPTDVFARTKRGVKVPIGELDSLIEFLLAVKALLEGGIDGAGGEGEGGGA